ncbi:MAG: PKD domain-containing protein [Crocinitomicaceae bacterium]
MGSFKNFIFFQFVFLAILGAHAQSPIANFTANPTSACSNVPISFNSTSNANGGPAITNYVWDFGDGSTGVGTTVTHSYSNSGTYTVTLVVTNASGIADAEVKPNHITILPSPNASYTVSGLSCTLPLSVSFINNTSPGFNINYLWNFGNSQTSTLANPPSQTYTTPGTYNTSLIAVNTSSGCSDTAAQPLVVSNYQTSFTTPNIICSGQTVNFTDNSTAGANQWTWNFGGLGTSSLQNPSFTFDTPGTYNIQLTSQNTISGCVGSYGQSITVETVPQPSFSANPVINCAPSTVTFNNLSSNGVSYSWDFGDASSSNNTSNLLSPSHTYENNGNYNVTLSMTTANGCTGSVTIPGIITVIDLVPVFTGTPLGGCDPLTVLFNNPGQTPYPNNPIVSWEWSFPGGTPSTWTGQTPPYVEYGVGVYDISLTLTTQNGCTGTTTQEEYVKVGEILDMGFSVDTTINCIKTDFEFTSFVVTNPSFPDSSEITYYWDFLEGTSNEQNPSYQFTSDTGYFDVQLVIDYRGCKDTVEIQDMVYILAPIANFAPQTTLFCNQGIPVLNNMTDLSTHGETSDDVYMTWEWGDGTPDVSFDDPELDDANAGNTNHTFSNYGSYTVEQVIHNYTTGCSDSTTNIVNVSSVTANFTYSNDTICQGDSLAMYDNSDTWLDLPSPHPLVSWEFNMGNNPPALVNMGDTAYYAYTAPFFGIQNYTITLTATNSVGCSDQATLPITVLPSPFPVLSLNPDPTVGCAPFTVSLTNGSIPFSGIPIDYYTFTYNNQTDTVDYIPYTPPLQNPNTSNLTFYNQGNNYVLMTVVDEFGCTATATSNPIIITKPFASFSMENIICNGDSLITVNTSTGAGNLSYQWFTENPTTSSAVSTTINASTIYEANNIVFGQTNEFTQIYLVVADSNGCTDTISNLLSVSIPWAIPNYSFSGAAIGQNGEYVCPPLFANFSDSSFSAGPITNWQWSFGNGNSSSLQNPSATYVFPGTYDLILQVTDVNGCTDDSVLIDYVTIGGPSGNPDWVQQAGGCAQGAQFVINNAQNIVSTIWEMGDNTTLNDSINFFYNYGSAGTYVPGVYLYDATGCEVFYPLDPITVAEDGLTALFTASPNPADQNQLITFTDASSSTQSNIVSWIWDFGTNYVASGSNISQSYSYPNSGPNPVTLTVIDAAGCQDDYTLIINIKDPEIPIPNVITLNEDNTNELFLLPFDGFLEFEIVIINRWGNTIHKGSKDIINPLLLWDGRVDSTGDLAEDGVYFWHLKGKMLGGTPYDKHGNVTVLESGQ